MLFIFYHIFNIKKSSRLKGCVHGSFFRIVVFQNFMVHGSKLLIFIQEQ